MSLHTLAPALDENGREVYSFNTATQARVKSGRFHCTTDGHNKWWKFTYDMDSYTCVTEWGVIGSPTAADNTKDMTPKEVVALVTSKLRKGYREVVEVPDPIEDEATTWSDAIDASKEDEYEIEDLVDWLANQQESNDFAKSLVTFYDDKGFLTPSQLSAARNMRAQATDPVTDPGMYELPDGTLLRVQRAKAGHLYALAYDENTEEWDLLKGGMKHLRGSMRVGSLP